MTMEIINNTPHDVNLVGPERTLTIPRSGEIARVEFEDLGQTQVLIEGTPVEVSLGKRVVGLTGVPEPQKDVLVMVSRVVKTELPGRDDLVVPDDLVRDEAGRVIGCRRLAR